jgi:CDP-paratose 2-epimerase
MRILISGVCGFVGSTLARTLAQSGAGHRLCGFDNFIRPGSESNRAGLKKLGVQLFHGDLRAASDLESLPVVDWVIDAAANPSVLAGVDGRTSSRQLVEHNLAGTVNLLEYCKRHHAGLILLSTSRVYSIAPLAALPVEPFEGAFRPASGKNLPPGLTAAGVDETFSTVAPVSLYGATKLASETLALEYGQTFGLPVFINRCGVLAGAGQFGRPDQGIFAYWLNSWLRRRPLAYLGFGGQGHQVRDCLHPRDLVPLLEKQFAAAQLAPGDRIVNVSGGAGSARSLRQLSDWCAARFGPHSVKADGTPRPFDIPWLVLDHTKAARVWGWRPLTPTSAILDEIATHAQAHPEWLELSAPL